MPPAAEAQSVHHWTTREVQLTCTIKPYRCTYEKPTQQLHGKLIWDKNSEQYPYYENPQILNIHPCFLVVCLSGAFRSFGLAQAAVVISREILQGESALLILAKQTCLSFLELWNYAACLEGREEWRVNLIGLTAQNNPVYMTLWRHRVRRARDFTTYLQIATEKLNWVCFQWGLAFLAEENCIFESREEGKV